MTDSMPPNCPWSGLAPATIHYCEENLCSLITQPANTWSNLGFVFVGLYLTWKASVHGPRALRLIGPIAIFVGVTSFAYHATFSFVGQVFDLGAMYCFSALLIVMNARRLGALQGKAGTLVFVGLVAGTTALVVLLRVVGIPLFAIQLAVALGLERRARAASPTPIDYRWFRNALITFALAYGCWLLDFFRVVCDPHWHLMQGHALWHLLDACIFLWLYRFYAQFTSTPAVRPV